MEGPLQTHTCMHADATARLTVTSVCWCLGGGVEWQQQQLVQHMRLSQDFLEVLLELCCCQALIWCYNAQNSSIACREEVPGPLSLRKSACEGGRGMHRAGLWWFMFIFVFVHDHILSERKGEKFDRSFGVVGLCRLLLNW